MAGYIGSKSSVTQVDGYSEAEADAEFVTKTGDTMTGNLSFGDNDKAIFGAGSDLQIYSDGSNSYIKDTGAGDLLIEGSDNIWLMQSGGAKVFLNTIDSNAINLYFNNSKKLETTNTGIDVTGTVTSDGLTVTQTGSTTATIGATGTSGDNDGTLIISNGGSGDGMLRFDYESNTDRARIGVSASSQNLQFYTAGNNERMRIDSSGRVGIGLTNASSYYGNQLVVSAPNEAGITMVGATNGESYLMWADGTSGGERYRGFIGYSHASNYMRFATESSERMRIDSSGNLLVGTTDASPYSAPSDGYIVALNDGSRFAMNLGATATSDRTVIRFNNPNGGVGGINTNGSSTVYYTSSDYRLKENVVDLTGASARVNQLNPSRFNFIADGTDTIVDGFLAHEVATVVPEAVTGTHNVMMDEEYEVTPAV